MLSPDYKHPQLNMKKTKQLVVKTVRWKKTYCDRAMIQKRIKTILCCSNKASVLCVTFV